MASTPSPAATPRTQLLPQWAPLATLKELCAEQAWLHQLDLNTLENTLPVECNDEVPPGSLVLSPDASDRTVLWVWCPLHVATRRPGAGGSVPVATDRFTRRISAPFPICSACAIRSRVVAIIGRNHGQLVIMDVWRRVTLSTYPASALEHRDERLLSPARCVVAVDASRIVHAVVQFRKQNGVVVAACRDVVSSVSPFRVLVEYSYPVAMEEDYWGGYAFDVRSLAVVGTGDQQRLLAMSDSFGYLVFNVATGELLVHDQINGTAYADHGFPNVVLGTSRRASSALVAVVDVTDGSVVQRFSPEEPIASLASMSNTRVAVATASAPTQLQVYDRVLGQSLFTHVFPTSMMPRSGTGALSSELFYLTDSRMLICALPAAGTVALVHVMRDDEGLRAMRHVSGLGAFPSVIMTPPADVAPRPASTRRSRIPRLLLHPTGCCSIA